MTRAFGRLWSKKADRDRARKAQEEESFRCVHASMPLYKQNTYARLHTAGMLARVHAHLYACTCIERMQTCMRVHQIPRTHDGAQVRSRARRGRLRGVCICVCVYVCVCMCVSWSVNCHCGGVCVWVSLYVRFLRVCACDRKHSCTRTRCTDKKEHRGSAHTGNLCARQASKRDKL